MERAAVITDMHANLPALEVALARVEELGIEHVYCGGDLVGYGPHPNEVCRLIEQRGIPTIYGNYDHAIGRDLEDCGCAYRDQHDRELGQRSIEWTLAHTDARSKAFMRGLPFDLRFELAGKRVRLVHGSPRKVNEYLFEDKPARTFERIAAGADCDVLVFGHTHQPWIHEYGGVLFVNCGSVGKPKDGDPRAAFAVLKSKQGEPRVRIERAEYDVESVARDVAEAGLPGEYAEGLLVAAWEGGNMKYVLFVCNHNAGRSQMAQAMFERYAPDDVRAESAGNTPAHQLWPEVVEVMRELDIDLAGRRPKKLTVEMQLHADWAITTGCGDACPYVPTTVEDWDVPDPAGKPIEEVRSIRDAIEARVRDLVEDRLDAIRSDRTAHQLRLARLLPDLASEFDGVRTPDEIRACADAILADYQEAPVRSFVMSIAHRRTRQCLKQEHCDALATA